MTAWKRPTNHPETLILCHAHNRFSNWWYALLDAATELDIPVCRRVYANHYDSSRDEEYLVPAGSKERIIALAERLHTERYDNGAWHV